MKVTVQRKKKQFGQLHPSGLNRHARRTMVAMERHKPEYDRRKKQEDAYQLRKDQKAESVRKKQDAAHKRALKRRAKAKAA